MAASAVDIVIYHVLQMGVSVANDPNRGTLIFQPRLRRMGDYGRPSVDVASGARVARTE